MSKKKHSTHKKKSEQDDQGFDEKSFLDKIDLKAIDTGLSAIYKNEDGTLPDMTHITKRSNWALVIPVFATVLFLGIVGTALWVGYMLFQPQSHFSEEDVTLAIIGTAQTQVGQSVHYKIRYRNMDNNPLAGVRLELRYPEGFTFVSSSVPSANNAHTQWELNSLSEYSGDEIDVFGVMYADVGSSQSLRAFLSYTPSNFSSAFQKVASFTTEVVESNITLMLDVPETIVASMATPIHVEVQGLASSTIDHVALRIKEKEGTVNFSDASIQADDYYENQWTIPKGTSNTFNFNAQASFEGKQDDTKTLIVELIGWNESARPDQGIVLHTIEKSAKLVVNDFVAQLMINGSAGAQKIAPGQIVNTSIHLKNNGDAPLEDVRVRLVFDTPSTKNLSMLDWAALVDSEDGTIVGDQISPDRRRGYITWDDTQIPLLTSLGVNAEVDIDVQIPLKTMEQIDLTTFPDGNIEIFVEVQHAQGNGVSKLNSNKILLKPASDIDITVSDSIADGEDDAQIHNITWKLENTYHDLSELSFSADFYGDIEFLPEQQVVPAGELTYDETKKRVTWKIDAMPSSIDVLGLEFAIKLKSKNPSQRNLSSRVQGTVFDDHIQETIVLVGDEILLN